MDAFFTLIAPGIMNGRALFVSIFTYVGRTYLAGRGGSTGVGRGNESMIIPADPLCGFGQSSVLSVHLRSHQSSPVSGLGSASLISNLIDFTSSPVCTEKCSRVIVGVDPSAGFITRIVKYRPVHQFKTQQHSRRYTHHHGTMSDLSLHPLHCSPRLYSQTYAIVPALYGSPD